MPPELLGARYVSVSNWHVEPRHGLVFDPDVPSGLCYRPDFISVAEERELAGQIAQVEFATFEMRGVAARRRVASLGNPTTHSITFRTARA